MAGELSNVQLTMMIQSTIASHGADITRIMEGFRELSQHRLSPALVNTTTLPMSIGNLDRLMKLQSYQLAVQQPEDIFKFETSHMVFLNGTLRIFVHIPAFKIGSRMKLMRFTPLPIMLPAQHSSSKHKFGMAKPESKLLAISTNELMFQTFTESQWGDCQRNLGITYCINNNVYDKRLADSCLVALYKQNVGNIGKICKWDMEVE